MSALLAIEGLHAGYGRIKVLHGLDMEVPENGVVTLLGANGAGKTTLLRAICNAISVQGRVTFAGSRIDGLPTEDIVRRGIAHVADGRGTFPNLTVEDNLRIGAYTRRGRGEIRADIEAMFALFPKLRQRRRQLAGTLSGGEQQMLAICRALLLRPRLLLLDEPSFGLAPLVVEEVFATFRRLKAESRMSILLIEQNARLGLDLADYAYLIDHGRIVLGAPSHAMRADDAVQRHYLGL